MAEWLVWISVIAAIVIIWVWLSICKANEYIQKTRNHLNDERIFHTVEEAQYDFQDRPRGG